MCPKCEGKGWNELEVFSGTPGDTYKVKEWCEECEGSGHIKYKGERVGASWGE